LQLSTDKNFLMFPKLKGMGMLINKKEHIAKLWLDPIFAEFSNINVFPLIYDEKKQRCNILVFNYELAKKRISRIAFEEVGKGRKHPVFRFYDDEDDYVCEVRYGSGTANALQRGLWTNTKNGIKYFDSVTNGWIDYSHIRNAQAPEKFTIKFLESLGFTSTNDRLIIGVLKALNFLDEASIPTQRYFEFLDDSQSKTVLAQGIRDAYADLFRVNNKANEMGEAEVKNKLKTLTQGTKSENVLRLMAMTFAALCKNAEFSKTATTPKQEKPTTVEPAKTTAEESEPKKEKHERKHSFDLAYNIHIELPATRDQAIYDAIFRSLKEHLL